MGRRRLRASGPDRSEATAAEKRRELEARDYVLFVGSRASETLSADARAVFGRPPFRALTARVGRGEKAELWVEDWALTVYVALKNHFGPALDRGSWTDVGPNLASVIQGALRRGLEDEDLRAAVLAADELGGLNGGRAVAELVLPRRKTDGNGEEAERCG